MRIIVVKGLTRLLFQKNIIRALETERESDFFCFDVDVFSVVLIFICSIFMNIISCECDFITFSVILV